jgi:hypothetical protein
VFWLGWLLMAPFIIGPMLIQPKADQGSRHNIPKGPTV